MLQEIYFTWASKRYVLKTDADGNQTIASIPYAGLHCEIINPSYALWREARAWEAEAKREYAPVEPKPSPSFWESHSCTGCGDGKRKCKEGRWNHCGWPIARNH